VIARLAATAFLLLLAVAAYFTPTGCDNCHQVLGAPFGIFFAVIAGIVWLGWDTFREWLAAAKENRPSSGRADLDVRWLMGIRSRKRRPPDNGN
jgi:hypothetical protein